jgi:DNA-binding beta-propeller fold protein YncE
VPSASAVDPAPGPSGYKLAATWKPGGEGRWDTLTVDPDKGRLYVTRENRVQVLDTTTGALIGEVPGLNGAHGVALVPSLNRGFATSGRDGKVVVFALDTLKPVGEPITTGSKPDVIIYDSNSNQVFAMEGGNHSIGVIDPAAAVYVKANPLPGAPEFAVTDGAGRLFVNLEDKSETVGLVIKEANAHDHWSLAPGEGPTGLAIDPVGHHLFAGCANQHMIVLDYNTGNIVADLPIGKHVDGTAFDPGTGYAFSSNGDGTLTVVAADASGQFKVLDTVTTKMGARTMAVDPKTHAVYTCTADFGPSDETTHGRPKPVPGTFVVLKYTR